MTDPEQQCIVDGCEEQAERTLQWPEPGGYTASFCDDHAEKKLRLTKVSEVNNA